MAEKRGSVRNGLQKNIYADGKICSPNKTCLCVDDGFARDGKLFEPAGRADDGIHAEHSKAPDIYRSRYRRRELHGDINAAQRFVRQALSAWIVAARKFRAHFEAVFRREPLDELAHFSVADDGEALTHACATPVARSCLTMRA